jgi:FixJ family two-component response regulator
MARLSQIKAALLGTGTLGAERPGEPHFFRSPKRRMSQPATVFIVDDDEAARDSLMLLLEAYGYDVQGFGSAREFLLVYRPRKRQCLVLDHHLRGETGLDFLQSIDGASLRLPVILVSGGGDRLLKERAHNAGVVAYFDKPLEISVLMTTILNATEQDMSR